MPPEIQSIMSNLDNLSYIDFEDLSRDIAQRLTGRRFSAFGPGPDGGIDGRYSEDGGTAILQSKHYAGSRFADLEKAIKGEVAKLEFLKPKRYLLFTSQPLTPANVNTLGAILGTHLLSPDDILCKQDIEGALRNHPDIEKSHIKLWLSSAEVLERILQSGLEEYSQTNKDEILEEVKVYAKNQSFDDAVELLEKEKVLIVSGPPGVGKTTLARMVTYHYLNDGWKFCAIRSLEDGFERIRDNERVVFFFDDFLGRIELNRQALQDQESAFAMFVKRVRKSNNARFILTTRAHIFEEARQISDYVGDAKLQLSKYILDVGRYSRKVKSHILFNHLAVSGLGSEHFAALLNGEWLKKIVDHKNYNPRVITSVSSDRIGNVEPSAFPQVIIAALDNPDQIWERPYHALNMRNRNLLTSIYFGSDFGEDIEVVRTNFTQLNKHISVLHGQPTLPDDFDNALRTMESGFISISGQRVSFVNPSLRDFLRAKLRDESYLMLLPSAAVRVDWASHLWMQMKGVFSNNPVGLSRCASQFINFCPTVETSPVANRTKNGNNWEYQHNDLPMTQRVDCLLQWWESTKDDRFIESALRILENKSWELKLWSTPRGLPELHWQVSFIVDDSNVLKKAFLSALQDEIANNLESISVDEFAGIFKEIQEYMENTIYESTLEQLERMIASEFEDVGSIISDMRESELSDHLEILEELANVSGRDCQDAKSVISERLAQLEERRYEHDSPHFSKPFQSGSESFSDRDMKSLFSTLIGKGLA